ncbi:MFS transporter [Paenibacillus sp. MER TA 81-3]|uniref:MFS transporter n=1 Tax=Paenibacillus sp. MER TA 81-3 TaxID=2939573 RepID=UPI0020419463|nr:MFS transporter [Paenibacillus sp. MER TA 81-3]MCM3340355.1 MFS transporter [Paenibacillus sp. MER TA 81-3]
MKLLLNNRAFRHLWLAQIVSELGDGITRLVVIFLVAHLSSNPLALSVVVLAQVLPNMLLGTFVGPFIDRFRRSLIMVAADLYRAVIVLLLIVFQNELYGIYALVLLQGIGTVLFEPARTAIVPRVVGQENITQAVSFSQATYMAMKLIGPALAGLLIPFGHFGWLFTFNSFTFVLSALFIFGMSRALSEDLTTAQQTAMTGQEEEQVVAKEPYWQSLKDGLYTIYRHDGLFALLILLVPIMLVMGVINTNLNAALLQSFRIPAEHFGFISSMIAAGSIMGALAAPSLLQRLRTNVMLLGAVGAIGLFCMLIVPLFHLYQESGVLSVYVWALGVGVSISCTNVPLSSLFITLMPDEMRGRGSGVFESVAQAGTVLGIGAGGLFASLFGVLTATAIAGLLLITVAAVFPLLKYNQALRQSNETKLSGGGQAASSSG